MIHEEKITHFTFHGGKKGRSRVKKIPLTTLFSELFKTKTALLLTNQNGEIFSCMLLGVKQIICVKLLLALYYVQLLIVKGSNLCSTRKVFQKVTSSDMEQLGDLGLI